MVETTIKEFKKFLDDQNELISELRKENRDMQREILTIYQVIKANYKLISQEFYQSLKEMDLDLEQDELHRIADELADDYTYPINITVDIKVAAANLKKYTWEELVTIDDEMIELVEREHKFWIDQDPDIDPYTLQSKISDVIEDEYFMNNSYIWAMLDDFGYIIGKVA